MSAAGGGKARGNRLRIIGGVWRSRVVAFDDAPGLRPTPDRLRETLFNWLQFDVAGSQCLDLFAGSGALGFEAASRGAAAVVQVESNPAVCARLKANIGVLAAAQVSVVQADVASYLQGPARPYDLIFLDPPFGRELAVPCCRWLAAGGWLAAGARIYVETERNLQLADLPSGWRQLKQAAAGEVACRLFQCDRL